LRPSWIRPVDSEQIDVTFTPAKKGPRSGKLKINDDAAGSPQKVTMTGKGT
jgi:hypothetical protein